MGFVPSHSRHELLADSHSPPSICLKSPSTPIRFILPAGRRRQAPNFAIRRRRDARITMPAWPIARWPRASATTSFAAEPPCALYASFDITKLPPWLFRWPLFLCAPSFSPRRRLFKLQHDTFISSARRISRAGSHAALLCQRQQLGESAIL